MQRNTIILALLAFGIPAVAAVAQTTDPVVGYQGACADNASIGHTKGITIGNPQLERNAVIALLTEQPLGPTGGTMEGEPGGGSGMGGSAGGVGAR